MNAPFSPILSATIAIVLSFVTVMGADAIPGAVGDAASPTAAPPSSSLDGMTFVAQSGEKGKQASNKDTIVFRNGRFLSEGCNPYGFGNAPYQATVDGATVRFHAETHSPTHGNMVWDGIVRGDTIEATNTWTRKRWYWNIMREYWYKGQLKK
jgi:hypothetical protein